MKAEYFVTKSRQVALLCSSSSEKAAQTLAQRIRSLRKDSRSFPCLTVLPLLQPNPLPAQSIKISSNGYLSDNAAGLVIFTSGTTARPKAAVMRRGYFHDAGLAMADYYRITRNDVLQHVLPVHHMLGVGLMFWPWLMVGAAIEFRSGAFDAEWMWEHWRRSGQKQGQNGGLTFFCGVPTIYMRLKRHFEQKIAKLDASVREEYVRGARAFKVMLCGTSALPHPIAAFWADVRGGKRIVQRYGATETGAVLKIGLDDLNPPDGSTGEITPGVDLKIAGDEDEGEILVRSSQMFSMYLDDPDATRNSHDEAGYFKTGDIARRSGKYFFVLGRASLDIIKSGGYKISALEVERELLSLPYVEECMVMGVEDAEFGQRVGCLLSLRSDQDVLKDNGGGIGGGGGGKGKGGPRLSIERLRGDLKSRLTRYKMPTLLRLVDGEIPKGGSGKIMKRVLGPRFFPNDWETKIDDAGRDGEIQVWRPGRRSIEKL